MCVETITRSPDSAAAIAGTRYAIDFPTPVPASATSAPPSRNVRSMAAASSRCSARSSYPTSPVERGPSLANTLSTERADEWIAARGSSSLGPSWDRDDTPSRGRSLRRPPRCSLPSVHASRTAEAAASRKNSAVLGPSNSLKAAISLKTNAGSSRAMRARWPRTSADVIASSSARCAVSGTIDASAARRCNA